MGDHFLLKPESQDLLSQLSGLLTKLQSQSYKSDPKPFVADSIESLIDVVSEIVDVVQNKGQSWRKPGNREELAGIVSQIFVLLGGQWQKKATYSDLLQLKTVLDFLSTIANTFREDTSAAWISVPIHRLICDIFHIFGKLITEAVPAGQKNFIADQRSSLNEIFLVYQSVAQTTTSSMIVVELATSIGALLVDYKGHLAKAGGSIIVGAVKSVLTMKVDEDLLKGIQKGLYAGYEMFKHASAEQQFVTISRLVPLRSTPMIPYSELVEASKCFRGVEGNWLLTSIYIDSLQRIVYCALKNMKENNSAECMKIIDVALNGDGCVTGICTLLKKMQRKPRAKTMISNCFYNSESLAGILRNLVCEAAGELIEAMESLEAGPAVADFLKPVNEALTGQGEAAAVKLQEVSANIKTMHKHCSVFLTGITKVMQHCKALQHSTRMFCSFCTSTLVSLDFIKCNRQKWPTLKADAIVWLKKMCKENLSMSEVLEGLSAVGDFGLNKDGGNISKLFLLVYAMDDLLQDVVTRLQLVNEIASNAVKSLGEVSTFIDDFQEDLIATTKKMEKANSSSSWTASWPKMPSVFRAPVVLSSADLRKKIEGVHETLKILNGKISTELALPSFVFKTASGALGGLEDFIFSVIESDMSIVSEVIEKKLKSSMDSCKRDIATCAENLKNCLPGVGGWWQPLSQFFGGSVFDSCEAMNIIREGAKAIFGPGNRPELVEESAVTALLELEIFLRQKNQLSKGSPQIADQLDQQIIKITQPLAFAKASSKWDTVRRVFNQEQYRAQVAIAVNSHWHAMESDLFGGIAADIKDHNAVKVQLNKVESGEAAMDATLSTIQEVIVNAGAEGTLTSLKNATNSLSKQGGLAGRVPFLLMELNRMDAALTHEIKGIERVVREKHSSYSNYRSDDPNSTFASMQNSVSQIQDVMKASRSTEEAMLQSMEEMRKQFNKFQEKQSTLAKTSTLDDVQARLNLLQDSMKNLVTQGSLEEVKGQLSQLQSSFMQFASSNRAEPPNAHDMGKIESILQQVQHNAANLASAASVEDLQRQLKQLQTTAGQPSTDNSRVIQSQLTGLQKTMDDVSTQVTNAKPTPTFDGFIQLQKQMQQMQEALGTISSRQNVSGNYNSDVLEKLNNLQQGIANLSSIKMHSTSSDSFADIQRQLTIILDQVKQQRSTRAPNTSKIVPDVTASIPINNESSESINFQLQQIRTDVKNVASVVSTLLSQSDATAKLQQQLNDIQKVVDKISNGMVTTEGRTETQSDNGSMLTMLHQMQKSIDGIKKTGAVSPSPASSTDIQHQLNEVLESVKGSILDSTRRSDEIEGQLRQLRECTAILARSTDLEDTRTQLKQVQDSIDAFSVSRGISSGGWFGSNRTVPIVAPTTTTSSNGPNVDVSKQLRQIQLSIDSLVAKPVVMENISKGEITKQLDHIQHSIDSLNFPSSKMQPDLPRNGTTADVQQQLKKIQDSIDNWNSSFSVPNITNYSTEEKKEVRETKEFVVQSVKGMQVALADTRDFIRKVTEAMANTNQATLEVREWVKISRVSMSEMNSSLQTIEERLSNLEATNGNSFDVSMRRTRPQSSPRTPRDGGSLVSPDDDIQGILYPNYDFVKRSAPAFSMGGR